MQKQVFITVIFLCCLSAAQAQADSVRRFVDSAVSLMQRHSIYAKKLDWKIIRDSATRLSASASSYEETLPALRYAFDQLGDKHGWLVINNKDYRNEVLQAKENRVSPNMTEAASKGPHIYRGVVAGRYAYLSMPFFSGQDTTAMNKFAQRLQDSLCSGIMPSTKGVILDLRLNAGGNSFPMITGVHNLYGKQQSRKDGKSFAGDWNVVNNELRLTETFYVRLQKNCGDLTHLPVAVLIGPVTGSSGEFIAIGFSTRPKTILIGEPTAGFTTANEGFELPGKNNGIVLAVSEAMDRNGNFYPIGVKPAISVSGDDFFYREADPKIKAAVKWLDKQQRSRKTRRK